MAEATSVPVLFVRDPDRAARDGGCRSPWTTRPRVAVDAAQASRSRAPCSSRRLDDRYPTGVLASIVQVGPASPAAAPPRWCAVNGRPRRFRHHRTGGGGGWSSTNCPDDRRGPGPWPPVQKLVWRCFSAGRPQQLVDAVNQLSDPSALADTAGYASYLTDVQKRDLLETENVDTRLRALIDWTAEHLAEVEVSDKISRTSGRAWRRRRRSSCCAATQRHPQELGELGPDGGRDSDDYRSRVRAADLPEKGARGRAAARGRQAGTLQRAEPEGGWIRTWLDTVWTCRGTSPPRTPPT